VCIYCKFDNQRDVDNGTEILKNLSKKKLLGCSQKKVVIVN